MHLSLAIVCFVFIAAAHCQSEAQLAAEWQMAHADLAATYPNSKLVST